MPRKAKPSPPLHIEGLSGSAQGQGQAPLADDFTGQPITPKVKPQLPRASAATVIAERKAEERKAVEAFLAKFNPPQVELVPKGWRKIGELDGKAVLVKNDPWRRI